MTEILPHPEKPVVVYALYNKMRRQYSRGGSGCPKWGKYPKTWGIGPFKNHLNLYNSSPYQFSNYYAPSGMKAEYFRRDCLIRNDHPYHDCEVLEIDPDGLTITARHDAIPWIYENSTKPYYAGQFKKAAGFHYRKYVMDFCKENGIKW